MFPVEFLHFMEEFLSEKFCSTMKRDGKHERDS